MNTLSMSVNGILRTFSTFMTKKSSISARSENDTDYPDDSKILLCTLKKTRYTVIRKVTKHL